MVATFVRPKALPSFARVRELLDYDPSTGAFTRKIGRNYKRSSKMIRGKVYVDGFQYVAARIAWLWMTGIDPGRMEVDHRDLNTRNDAWANLRLATPSQNNANKRKRADSSCGLKGAHRNNGSWWYSHITKDGVYYYLGAFPSAQAAHEAYMAKARELFGEFARAA